MFEGGFISAYYSNAGDYKQSDIDSGLDSYSLTGEGRVYTCSVQ
jgi:hypothetical protein